MAEHEKVLDCYKYTAKRPSDWNNLFPHSKGHTEYAALSSFIIVTENGILECKPRLVSIFKVFYYMFDFKGRLTQKVKKSYVFMQQH